MDPGIELRLQRLRVPGSDAYLTIPMDHGISIGPVPGIVDIPATLDAVARGGASAVVFHKGNARYVPPYAQKMGFLLHLSASTSSAPDPDEKVLVTTVEEAVALGADAVSTHTNFGARTEARQVVDLGQVTRDAHRYGLPHLSMAYPRGPDVHDPFDVDRVKAAARTAAECGADIVKTVYTGDPETFREVVRGCPAPVIIAGGPRVADDIQLLETIAGAQAAGAKGVSIGRNIFQHDHPDRMVAAIRAILVDGAEAAEAHRHLEKPLPA